MWRTTINLYLELSWNVFSAFLRNFPWTGGGGGGEGGEGGAKVKSRFAQRDAIEGFLMTKSSTNLEVVLKTR